MLRLLLQRMWPRLLTSNTSGINNTNESSHSSNELATNFRRLPVELQMQIFKQLPWEYIPHHYRSSSYFVKLWRKYNIRHSFEISAATETIVGLNCYTVNRLDYEGSMLVRRRQWTPVSEAELEALRISTDGNNDNMLSFLILRSDTSHRHNQLHGVCNYYRQGGQLQRSANYRHGQPHGQFISYSLLGIQQQSNYRHSRLYGWSTKSYTNSRRKRTLSASYYINDVEVLTPLLYLAFLFLLVLSLVGLIWFHHQLKVSPPTGWLLRSLLASRHH